MPVSNDVTTEAASTNRHPLNDFWGTLEDVSDYSRPQAGNPNKSNTIIKFDMSQLEIIESREPYSFPVTTVEIMEINIPNSQWEAWKESVRKCGFVGRPINELISKRLHWKWTTALLSTRIGNPGAYSYVNQEGYCFQIVEIEGIANTSGQLMDAIVGLADGKNASEFKTAFMADGSIRGLTGYAESMVGVVNNTLLETLVNSGKLTVDGNGNYHKVG